MYEFLIQKNYPGNVRELENLVNKMAYRNHGQGSISFCHIPMEDWPRSPDLADQALKTEFYRLLSKMILSGYNLNDLKNTVIENAKEIAVTIENGNVQKAAERLGCSDRLLQLYLHKSN